VRGEISDSEDDSDDDDSEEENHRNARARLLSQCSEDGFITFEESPKIKSPIDTKKCSQFLKDFLAGKGEEESEEGSCLNWVGVCRGVRKTKCQEYWQLRGVLGQGSFQPVHSSIA